MKTTSVDTIQGRIEKLLQSSRNYFPIKALAFKTICLKVKAANPHVFGIFSPLQFILLCWEIRPCVYFFFWKLWLPISHYRSDTNNEYIFSMLLNYALLLCCLPSNSSLIFHTYAHRPDISGLCSPHLWSITPAASFAFLVWT